MDGYLALVRTHGRTDATENNSPSPINRGTKTMDGSKVMKLKVSFLAILGHFGAFLALKSPWGRNEDYFQKSENIIFIPYVVTSCKISEKNTMVVC